MLRNKNTIDEGLCFDDIFQESIDINTLFMTESNHFPMETIQKFFQKRIKLRNVSKQSYWKRKTNQLNPYLIKVSDLIPMITLSQGLISSVKEYIDNESSILIGKIHIDKKTNCYSSIIDSKSEKNVMINPRLICNKEEKKNKLLSMFETAYNDFNYNNNKNINCNDNGNALSYCRNLNIFNRKENFTQSSYSILYKVHTIVPNANFELNQIKNLSLSNTQLNKFLALKSYENDSFDPKKQLKNGFLTMSQEHRLICLRDDTNDKDKSIKLSQSLKRIIFGIWLNMKDESPSPRKIDLDNLLTKHKEYIYQKCFEFIQLTSSIDSVYSPSPDQGIFLLVIFYKNMQCHYEVTLIPNEENSVFTSRNEEERKLFAHRFSPQWVIVKNKYVLNVDQSLMIDLKKEVFNGRIMTMNDYLAKKTGMKSKSILTKSTATRITTPSKLSSCNYFKDTLNEIFDNTGLEIDDADDDLYNYPLIMPGNFKSKESKVSIANTIVNPTLKNEVEDSHNNTIFLPQNPKEEDVVVDKDFKPKDSFKKSISNHNLKDKIMTTSIKSIEEVSHASTNVHSTKVSLGSINRTSFTKPNISGLNNQIPNKYITIIHDQSKAIKILQNKISALESNINSVINVLALPNNNTTEKKEDLKESNLTKEKVLLTERKTEQKNTSKLNFLPHYRQRQLFSNEKFDESANVSIKIPCIRYNPSIISEDEDSNIYFS